MRALAGGSSEASRIAPRAPGKPGDGADHSDPAQDADNTANLRVVFEHSCVREKIEPVVLGIFRIAHGHVLEALASRVGHVDSDGQKLLEEKERTKGSAGRLPLK